MNSKQLEQKLKQLINDIVDGPFLNQVGAKVVDIIYKRVKSGYGVNDDSSEAGNASKQKLAPLSKSYKEQRAGKLVIYTDAKGRKRAFAPKNPRPLKLGEFGSPTKSNLTKTGQMLNAIVYRIISKGIKVYIRGNSRSDDSQKTNRDVAELVAKNGRPFFNITDGEYRIVEQMFGKHISKLLKEFK